MKRIVLCLVGVLLLVLLIPRFNYSTQAANIKTKSRRIHIVYDDSGSMRTGGGKPRTRWSQAKYAIEVFAAMMGAADTLTIYPMTAFSFDDNTKQPSGNFGQTVTISGDSDNTERVQLVKQLNGDEGIYRNTPLQTVEQAAEDLLAENADDKWLIILTDGAFDNGFDGQYYEKEEVKEKLLGYANADDFRMIYIGIDLEEDERALDLTGDKGIAGFYPFSVTSDTILETVTEAARTVFNLQTISCTGKEPLRFEADIPVSKVIIFAQGDEANVGPLQYEGEPLERESVNVLVSVTPEDGYAPKDAAYARGLEGEVVTYTASEETMPMAAGSYSFSTSAQSTEVYFEPGVAVRAVLTNSSDETYDIFLDGDQVLPVGDWKVELQIYDPLTGKELDPDNSALLNDPQISLLISKEGEEPQVLRNGDTFSLDEGNVTFQSVIGFSGDIEKSSEERNLEVVSLDLQVAFEKESYEFDPVSMTWDETISAKVTDEQGDALPQEMLESLDVQIGDLDGLTLSWEMKDTGVLVFTGGPDDENAEPGDFPLGEQILNVTVNTPYKGLMKTGSASASVNIAAKEGLELVFSFTPPEQYVSSGSSSYMFDPEVLGPSDEANYLLVSAGVRLPDGSVRQLSENEFSIVESNLRYTTKARGLDFGWRLVAFLCRQNVQFTYVPDQDTSSFKFYLDGKNSTRIRVKSSELSVSVDTSLVNGLPLKGSSSTIITVKPLPWYMYFLPALITAGFLLLLTAVIIMEIRKPRFSPDMYPVTIGVLRENGTPMDPALLPRPQESRYKIRYRLFPPWRPEERFVVMRYGEYLPPIYFTCIAMGGGNFRIADVTPFMDVKDVVDFQGRTYDMMGRGQVRLSTGSQIRILIDDGDIKGQVILKFRKR